MIQYTELLWEMAAKRKGEKVRWRVIIAIEGMKAICRVCLMWITNSRPLVTPALPEREVIPEETPEEEEEFSEGTFSEVKPKEVKEYKMKRTGLSLPTLPNPSDISSYLLSKVLTADDIKAPNALLNKTNGSAQLAELLHILQPLIYAVAMSRSKDKRDWQPWLLGLSIQLASRQLRKDGLRTTVLESQEWNRRGWNMLMWTMRGGFYENVTKGFLHRTSEKLPGLKVRVVSFPSWELFEEQTAEYKDSVFTPGVPVLSVEAGAIGAWSRYAHGSIGMKSFGASAPAPKLYEKFGFTAESIAKNAQVLVDFYKGNAPALLHRPPITY